MQTILGPFHPFLEDALVDEILRFKQAGVMEPLLVLVPSDVLRRRIKILLSRERGLALLNVQMLTFYQLSCKLNSEAGQELPELRDDLFLEEVLRQMIRSRQAGAEPYAKIEERVGGCAALWQTLRDLRDGWVDPDFASAALGEAQLEERSSAAPAELLGLFKTFASFCRAREICSVADLDKAAIEQIPTSRFLQQFTQVMYYGFYDLTQIQVDLFQVVAKNFPTTLFFPLLSVKPSHGGWSFAERFFERYIQGQTTGPAKELTEQTVLPATFGLFDEDPERIYRRPPKNWRLTIFSAFGIDDEVSAAAKEILRLVADEGLKFSEVSVVARHLEAYGAAIQEKFDKHKIPLAGRFEEPLAQFPLTKAVILLLNLPAKNLPRAMVIDFLSSPYLRAAQILGAEIPARPDLWDLATRELAICKGIAEWRRLRNFAGRDLALGQIAHDEERRVIHIPTAHLIYLADLVETLAADLAELPERAPWSVFAGVWKRLIDKYLGVAPPGARPAPGIEPAITESLLKVLDQLPALDSVEDDIALGDFSQTLQHWLERSVISEDRRNLDGVFLLNASAARGLACRALFVLGMNEGVFPRTIREDPFLRDRDRELLERDLGYKISQKLAGFDEEKLLFNLLANSARERLYCSFQRADDGGRALAPSWYLSELKRALGSAHEEQLQEISIPRSACEKSAIEIFGRQNLLLPEELAIRLSLNGEDPSALVEAGGLTPVLYKKGKKAVARLDQSTERLHEFDGLLGPLPEHWRALRERGISPTALETYAACPFQFFARHVLRLERLERPEEAGGLSTADFGELGHAILRECYRRLIDSRYFESPSDDLDVAALVTAVAERAFEKHALDHAVGYPLQWEYTKEILTQLIQQFVSADLSEISLSGYLPIGLEVERKEAFPPLWPEPLAGMAMHGRMDRIDENRTANRRRVIDYKFKFSGAPSTQDKDLWRAALRGQKLQPLFYCILGKGSASADHQAAPPEVEARFYYIAQRWRDEPFLRASFAAEELSGKVGSEIRKTVAGLASGIRSGEFFMQRNAACRYCEVAEICRKNHPPSLWRAENDPVTALHRELRKKETEKL